jgi:hypothetical protein
MKQYFTGVYLFCLHKDTSNPTKLRPLGIQTTIHQLIASHVACSLKEKIVSHLLPFNYAIGIPNGSSFDVKAMQLAIKKFIDTTQHAQRLPSSATVFFDLTNQFNMFFNIMSENFPELLPLTTLFYNNPNTIHHKWDEDIWQHFLMLEAARRAFIDPEDGIFVGILHLLGYMDDISSCIYLPNY